MLPFCSYLHLYETFIQKFLYLLFQLKPYPTHFPDSNQSLHNFLLDPPSFFLLLIIFIIIFFIIFTILFLLEISIIFLFSYFCSSSLPFSLPSSYFYSFSFLLLFVHFHQPISQRYITITLIHRQDHFIVMNFYT